MHELSLCENIIDSVSKAIATKDIDKNNAIKVYVTLGALVGVDKSSLEFWFPIVAERMTYVSLTLEITDQPAIGQCITCHEKFSMESLMDPCLKCGGFERDILSGMAFDISKIDIK
jgi:hydrogenase nickel incorporation protein HypA/HybF